MTYVYMCSRIDSYIKQFFFRRGDISQWMLKVYYVYIITDGFQVNGKIMYINFTKTNTYTSKFHYISHIICSYKGSTP